MIGQTHFLERLEEPVQILCQEPPAKDRIDPCPNKSSVTGSFIAHWPVKYSWKSYSQVFVARLPAGRKLDRTAGEGVFRPDVSVPTSGHRMSVAFVFPGQGSQVVGMGKSLAANFTAAQDVFDEVDSALDRKLSTVIFEGPADTLMLTENAQPALMDVSLAEFRAVEKVAGVRW